MIVEGFKLMIIGMVIVYIFLITLMFLVMLTSKFFKGKPSAATPTRTAGKSDGNELIAVISAAIAAYRSKKQ